ncbi:MAG: hypothetical protein ACRDBG_10080, partial [Waterburya sp.]
MISNQLSWSSARLRLRSCRRHRHRFQLAGRTIRINKNLAQRRKDAKGLKDVLIYRSMAIHPHQGYSSSHYQLL